MSRWDIWPSEHHIRPSGLATTVAKREHHDGICSYSTWTPRHRLIFGWFNLQGTIALWSWTWTSSIGFWLTASHHLVVWLVSLAATPRSSFWAKGSFQWPSFYSPKNGLLDVGIGTPIVTVRAVRAAPIFYTQKSHQLRFSNVPRAA